uniref:Uncharacterized protein n=1 Tax=Romanomermis culicivorax TaxID=13658 RepID=A0A915I225_ROMCU
MVRVAGAVARRACRTASSPAFEQNLVKFGQLSSWDVCSDLIFSPSLDDGSPYNRASSSSTDIGSLSPDLPEISFLISKTVVTTSLDTSKNLCAAAELAFGVFSFSTFFPTDQTRCACGIACVVNKLGRKVRCKTDNEPFLS